MRVDRYLAVRVPQLELLDDYERDWLLGRLEIEALRLSLSIRADREGVPVSRPGHSPHSPPYAAGERPLPPDTPGGVGAPPGTEPQRGCTDLDQVDFFSGGLHEF